MTKKEIINTLREMGFKANYKNVLISTYEEKGYITARLPRNQYGKVIGAKPLPRPFEEE